MVRRQQRAECFAAVVRERRGELVVSAWGFERGDVRVDGVWGESEAVEGGMVGCVCGERGVVC